MKALGKIGQPLAIIIFLIAGISYGQSTIQSCFSKGLDYVAQGKFKEAKEEFGKLSKDDRYYGTTELALKIIEDVSAKKIASKTAIHLFSGIACALEGQWDEAIAECG